MIAVRLKRRRVVRIAGAGEEERLLTLSEDEEVGDALAESLCVRRRREPEEKRRRERDRSQDGSKARAGGHGRGAGRHWGDGCGGYSGAQ